MQKIKIKDVSLSFGDRLLFHIDELNIEENEKIGVVGPNGCGKTTFLEMLAGNIEVSGDVFISSVTYIKQFEEGKQEDKHLSGGEKTKRILYQKMRDKKEILLLDEPTNHLDMKSIKELSGKLKKEDRVLVLVSHNRDFLNEVCTSIIEIDNREVTVYKGSFDEYKKQKKERKDREFFLYENYVTEKNRLEKSIIGAKNESKKIRKAPRRMGNSEARLHRRESTEIIQKLSQSRKSVETRLKKLEKIEKPKEQGKIIMDMSHIDNIKARRILAVDSISISFGKKQILENASFTIINGSKVALLGDNGTGKTSLIRSLLSRDKGVYIHPDIKIAYFSQELEGLEKELSVFEYVRKYSIQEDRIVENVLARLLLKGTMLDTKIRNISGGEKVKVALASILLSDASFLILDEVTNFLDMQTLESLEELLKEYKGTILFTSHDKHFIDKVSTSLLLIENKKIISYIGNYSAYLESKRQKKDTRKQDHLVLDMRIAYVTSRLSENIGEKEKEELEQEYADLLKKKRNLR